MINHSRYSFQQKLNYFKFNRNKIGPRLNYEPINISIVATGRCNFSCNMCPTHSKIIPKDYPYIQNTKKDMSFETFKIIMEKFYKARNVLIIGSGEPLLNKDLFKMVDYAATYKRMKVGTVSNGVAIENNINEVITSSLYGITISINGHNAKEFNRMTGMDENWYPKICCNVNNLVEKRTKAKSNVKINISFIIDKHNYLYIPDMITIARDLGVDHTFFHNFLPSPYDGFRVEERTVTVNDVEIVSAIKKIRDDIPESIKKNLTFPLILDTKCTEKKCKSHFSMIRIDGDGNVGGCSIMLSNMEGHGNFLDTDVWNNQFFQDMRARFLEYDKEALLDPCKVCVWNYGVYPW